MNLAHFLLLDPFFVCIQKKPDLNFAFNFNLVFTLYAVTVTWTAPSIVQVEVEADVQYSEPISRDTAHHQQTETMGGDLDEEESFLS